MEHLDRYEREGIDEGFVEDITAEQAMGARAAAEDALERRDQREGRVTGRRRLPGALDGALTGTLVLALHHGPPHSWVIVLLLSRSLLFQFGTVMWNVEL